MVITIVSASEFPSCVPNAATAVLRIYEPIQDWTTDAAEHATDGWGPFLPLAFWDVGKAGLGLFERLVIRLLGRHRSLCLKVGQKLFGDEIPWRPFLPADACDIRAFTDEVASRGVQGILVVCTNGRARSWTIAKWMAEHLGTEPPSERGWQRENDEIARTLSRVCPLSRLPSRHVTPRAAFGH